MLWKDFREVLIWNRQFKFLLFSFSSEWLVITDFFALNKVFRLGLYQKGAQNAKKVMVQLWSTKIQAMNKNLLLKNISSANGFFALISFTLSLVFLITLYIPNYLCGKLFFCNWRCTLMSEMVSGNVQSFKND